MRCSVVILNWNGERVLREFLPSVLACTQAEDTEVVVVDNGSTDNSVAYLQEIADTPDAVAAHFRIVSYETNYGFAAGYNKAIASISSTYTVLLNSDVFVTPNWLEPILDYMDAHSDVSAAQPKILSYQSWLNHRTDAALPITFEHAGAAGGYIDKLGYPYCRGRIMSYVAQDNGQYDTIADIFWASGAALFVRTNIYMQAGGLDPDFFAHMEEIDFCWRLNCRGNRIVCIPQSKVYHLGGGSLPYNNPRKTYLNFRNNLYMLYKNLPSSRMHRVLFYRFFLDYIAAFHELIKLDFPNFRAIIRARIDFLRTRRTFAQKRAENMTLSTIAYPSSISERSIIFDYFLRGKRE